MDRKTRIVEFVDGNGKHYYRCQYKWLRMWWYYKESPYYMCGDYIPVEFNNCEDARRYIEERLYVARSQKRKELNNND